MTASMGNPYDTPVSATTRFVMELACWILGPWAAADLVGSGWVAVPTLIVLVALPALFNTPGDKKAGGISTPGPVRIAIEMVLFAAAILSSTVVGPPWFVGFVTIGAVLAVGTGRQRYRWLAAGAPAVTDSAGSSLRKLQTGRVQQYATSVVVGALVLVIVVVLIQ